MGKEWLEVNSNSKEECRQKDDEDSEHDMFEDLSTGGPSWCRAVGEGRIGSWGGERKGLDLGGFCRLRI